MTSTTGFAGRINRQVELLVGIPGRDVAHDLKEAIRSIQVRQSELSASFEGQIFTPDEFLEHLREIERLHREYVTLLTVLQGVDHLRQAGWYELLERLSSTPDSSVTP